MILDHGPNSFIYIELCDEWTFLDGKLLYSKTETIWISLYASQSTVQQKKLYRTKCTIPFRCVFEWLLHRVFKMQTPKEKAVLKANFELLS